jgi:hypothetical protein
MKRKESLTQLEREKKSLAKLGRERRKELWKEKVSARMKKTLLLLLIPTLRVIKWTPLQRPQLATAVPVLLLLLVVLLQLLVCLLVWEDWGGIVASRSSCLALPPLSLGYPIIWPPCQRQR